MKTKIVILTPGQLGSNPRVVKEAYALHNAGYRIHVIATKVADFVEPRDQAVLSVAPWSVERIAFDRKSIWGYERLLQEAARRVRALVPSPRLTSYAHSAFARRLAAAALAHPADLYIAHYPAALIGAARAAATYGAAYAFDAEDFHLGDLPDLPEHAVEKQIIRAIESQYLPGASFVTAASPHIAEAYAETYGITKPTVILNVFPKGNGPSSPTSMGSATPRPSVYWFSQTIGEGRGLETAVEATAIATSCPHLHLRGTFAVGYEKKLRAHAAQHGVSERLHIHAPVSPDEVERAGAEFDLGYVGETGFSANNNLALANKLFSYLVSGLPIIASNTPAHISLIGDLAGAMRIFPISDARSLASSLDETLLNPNRLTDARLAAWTLGQTRCNWEMEQNKLLAVVSGALKTRPSRTSTL